jgi:hypothetical protein
LHIAYLSGFKKGGQKLGVCIKICRSLFHYYGDLFYYSTTYLPIKREGQGGKTDRERGGRRGRESRPTLDIFKEERRREREKGRRRRRRRRRKGTSLPLKTDLTLVTCKILEKTLIL